MPRLALDAGFTEYLDCALEWTAVPLRPPNGRAVEPRPKTIPERSGKRSYLSWAFSHGGVESAIPAFAGLEQPCRLTAGMGVGTDGNPRGIRIQQSRFPTLLPGT